MIVGGGFSQPAIANTFQPGGGHAQVGTAAQQPKPEQTQPAQAPSAESQKVEDQRQQERRAAQQQAEQARAEARRSSETANTNNNDRRERGQLLDVSA